MRITRRPRPLIDSPSAPAPDAPASTLASPAPPNRGSVVRPGLLAPSLPVGAGPAWHVRAADLPRLPDGRVDARAHCARVLEHIQRVRRAHPSHPCAVVFDLDNTLFDTRARTLYALRRFDAEHGTAHFAGLSVDDVGWSGKETCGRLGLDPELTARVHELWDRVFWSGDAFAQDLVMLPLFELAWAAKEAGAEVRYLTGRIDDLAAASLEQLVQAGLPDARPECLFCKPSLETRTGPFKAEKLAEWMDAGHFVGWFATDNRAEVEDVLALGAANRYAFPVVHVEHALQRPGVVANDVPAFPEADLSRRATPAETRALHALTRRQ
ncbi:MAG: hypothetical protein KC933_08595 [Myxococcales bacterium]|nr:hypothetical protein [Myxococcales bacterium]